MFSFLAKGLEEVNQHSTVSICRTQKLLKFIDDSCIWRWRWRRNDICISWSSVKSTCCSIFWFFMFTKHINYRCRKYFDLVHWMSWQMKMYVKDDCQLFIFIVHLSSVFNCATIIFWKHFVIYLVRLVLFVFFLHMLFLIIWQMLIWSIIYILYLHYQLFWSHFFFITLYISIQSCLISSLLFFFFILFLFTWF